MVKLLVIDNYDSFTFNLVQMFRLYPVSVTVHRHDAATMDELRELAPDYVVVGPGPRDPAHAGLSRQVLREFGPRVPTLGVCLGMQCLNEIHGGRTVRCEPVHGKTSAIEHSGRGLFAGLPEPLTVARYHSLATEPAGDELVVTARTRDGVIMGLSHREQPVHGVQFHPESFLTPEGARLVDNFMALGPAGRLP